MARRNENEVNDVVRRAQEGDGQAFEHLFKQFGRPLYGTIERIVGDRDGAEELLQDVFLKIYQKLGSFDHRSSFYTWAYRVAVNMSLNHLKSRQSRRETRLEPEQWAARRSTSDRDEDAGLMREATRAAIQKVPPRQRAVLVMRIYDGMDYATVAKTLGCSEGAAKASFHQAMQKLRKYLKDFA